MAGEPLTQLGRYRIVGELGRGAMGVVYKAQDPSLDRTVAIKTILLAPQSEERAEYEGRFEREAKAAGGLNHPNIVTIHDVGREGDIAYMAMEMLEGMDLRQLMKAGPLALEVALEIGAQVAEGLAFAHERGVVHRDIKPANIMIVRGQHAKITDFGIARARLADSLTQVGSVLGSPRYMSPEQAAGQRADHRSDIFSLGVTLYELLTGRAPFSAEDLAQLMFEVSSAMPPAPSSLNPAIPEMFDLIVAKALEKLPEARYQSARELAVDLRTCRAQLAAHEAPEATVIAPAESAGTTRRMGSATRAALQPLQLPLSRRFDCAAALQSLASPAPAAPPSAKDPAAALRLWLRDPHQRAVAAGIAVAAVVGLLIALT